MGTILIMFFFYPQETGGTGFQPAWASPANGET